MLKQINNQKNYTYSPYQNYYLMSSIWGYKTFIRITTDERGLLFKNGNYKKVLRPGKYLFFPLMGYRVRKMNVNQNFITEKNLNIYLDDKRLLEELLVSDIKDYEIALHYEDGHFTEILVPGKYAFWKVLKNHQIISIDTREPEVTSDIDKSIFEKPELSGRFFLFEVANYEKGLLFYNGIFQKILEPGKYYFWKGPVGTNVQKVDMRKLQIDISGQEIMTEDKISLRLNFVCHYRITEPVKATLTVKSYEEQIYILLQLILREYIGTLKLDDLLSKKEEIGNFVLSKLKDKNNDFGIEFIFAGLKDIILPGEMKNILNQVVEAEKKAQANIITRREETASTRSLLNTVKLMENNPLLLRIKELEYLERICEKIDKLTLVGGGNLLEQLLNSVVKGKDL